MKAFTVSSEGRRVLNVGARGRASFALEVFSCATPSDPSRRTKEQQNAKRCMGSFPEFTRKIYLVKAISSLFYRTGVKIYNQHHGGRQESPPHTSCAGS